MKYSKIALACSLAVATMSAQAALTLPATLTTVFLAGASGPDTFLNEVANSMLTGVVAMKDSTNNYRGYLGKANGIPGITNGTNILFLKRSAGGSAFGVNSLAKAERLTVLDVATCASAGAASGTGTLADPYVCPTKGNDNQADLANNGRVPDLGVSDVEPALFKAPHNAELGAASLTAAQVAKLTVKPVNLLMQGMVATDAVPDSTYLSRAQYAAMLTNKVNTWDQIDPALSGNVTVCRRTPGSGTQAASNWFFTGFPCTNAVKGDQKAPVVGVNASAGLNNAVYGAANASTATANIDTAPGDGSGANKGNPIWINPVDGYTVMENSGSGDVRNCLKAAQAGTDHFALGHDNKWYGVAFSKVGGATKAIGVLGLDSLGKESGWHFRMMDGAGKVTPVLTGAVVTDVTPSAGATGIAPTKANLLAGKYDFAVELTMQRRNVSVTNAFGDVVAAPSAQKISFMNELVKRLGDPAYTGGKGGNTTNTVAAAYATLPSIGSVSTDPAFVSAYTHEGNTCSPLHHY